MLSMIDSEESDDEDYVPKKKKKKSSSAKVKKPEANKQKPQKSKPKLSEKTDTGMEVDDADALLGPPQGRIKVMVCCVCLSDRSADDDEIVECDNCGISVHEGLNEHC